MGETADQIRLHVERTRAKLGQDLNDLEYRVRQGTDWRVHFNRRPWTYLIAAFAVAALLGLTGKRRRAV